VPLLASPVPPLKSAIEITSPVCGKVVSSILLVCNSSATEEGVTLTTELSVNNTVDAVTVDPTVSPLTSITFQSTESVAVLENQNPFIFTNPPLKKSPGKHFQDILVK